MRTRCLLAAWLVSGCADRKSTRLNSSHLVISYADFCLKKNISGSNDLRRLSAPNTQTVNPHSTDRGAPALRTDSHADQPTAHLPHDSFTPGAEPYPPRD